MVMGRFLIDIYPISPFTSIRGTGPKYGSGVSCLSLKKSLGVGQPHFIGQRVMHHSKKMTDL